MALTITGGPPPSFWHSPGREDKKESREKERLDFNRYIIIKKNVLDRGGPAPNLKTTVQKQRKFLCFHKKVRASQFSRRLKTVTQIVYRRWDDNMEPLTRLPNEVELGVVEGGCKHRAKHNIFTGNFFDCE